MERMRRGMLYFILMGMFLLTAGVGTFKLAANNVSPTSVVEEVDDEVDQSVSAKAVTEFTFDENSSSLSAPSGTISVNTTYTYKNLANPFSGRFTPTATISSGATLNIIFDGCYFNWSSGLVNLSSITVSSGATLNVTLQDCQLSFGGTAFMASSNMSGTANYYLYNCVISNGGDGGISSSASSASNLIMTDVLILSNGSSFVSGNFNCSFKNVHARTGTFSAGTNGCVFFEYDGEYYYHRLPEYQDVRVFTSNKSNFWTTNWDFENKWVYYLSGTTTSGVYPVTRSCAKSLGWTSDSFYVAVYANYDWGNIGQNYYNRLYYPKPTDGKVTLRSSDNIFSRGGYKLKWAYSPDEIGRAHV